MKSSTAVLHCDLPFFCLGGGKSVLNLAVLSESSRLAEPTSLTGLKAPRSAEDARVWLEQFDRDAAERPPGWLARS